MFVLILSSWHWTLLHGLRQQVKVSIGQRLLTKMADQADQTKLLLMKRSLTETPLKSCSTIDGWVPEHCKSGELLCYRNKLTGERRWPSKQQTSDELPALVIFLLSNFVGFVVNTLHVVFL